MNSDSELLQSSAIQILAELGKLPATSYWEDGPTKYLAVRAKEAGLDVSLDQWGNVLAT